MAFPSTEVNVEVKNTLDSNWNTGNTSISSKPKFHTGIYDEDTNQPQVSVETVTETSTAGGTTGYSYIVTDGSGGGQDRDGVLDVGLWASRDDADNVHPKKLTYEMLSEVNRIVLGQQKSVSGTRYVSPLESEYIPETDREPIVHHRVLSVGYAYDNRP